MSKCTSTCTTKNAFRPYPPTAEALIAKGWPQAVRDLDFILTEGAKALNSSKGKKKSQCQRGHDWVTLLVASELAPEGYYVKGRKCARCGRKSKVLDATN